MQHSLSRLGLNLALCLAATFAASCATAPATVDVPASMARAELLLQQNNPAAAAKMYEQLADGNPPPASSDLALSAARAWLAANRPDDARRVLDAHGASLTPAQQFELALVRSELAMVRGQYAPAWQEVSKISTPVRPADASRLFLLRQQVALRAGQAVEAVRAGIERERVATTDTERTRARRDLLTDLRSAIDGGLKIDLAASRDDLVRGWLEIGQIAASSARNPMNAPAALERWRGRYPGHPAVTIAASEIITPGTRATQPNAANGQSAAPPMQSIAIALLLPLTSNQSQVSTAATLIRDGFTAAVSRMPEAGRPVVRVYDTNTLTVPVALKNARADGAGMVVGPLTKADVQAAAEERSELPMLLLNNLAGNSSGANLYQFALAPEDEARQIARQMAASGKRNALVLTPSNDWGTRVATAFADELNRSGGHVAAQAVYDMASSDLTARVTSALGIDDSRARNDKLRSITSAQFEFEPRPRPDVDAIFVAGYLPGAGVLNPMRLIYPVLNKYASELPTFMTQDGLDVDASANRDLLGMYVLDMPWMLDATGTGAELRTATESTWGPKGLRQSRYFAFGFDAANLAVAIRRPATTWPLVGLTGHLALTPEGRVERTLQWARVSGAGQVQSADPPAP